MEKRWKLHALSSTYMKKNYWSMIQNISSGHVIMIPWFLKHHHHNHARSFNSLLQMIPRIMRWGISSARIFPLQKAFMRAMKIPLHANTVKNHLPIEKLLGSIEIRFTKTRWTIIGCWCWCCCWWICWWWWCFWWWRWPQCWCRWWCSWFWQNVCGMIKKRQLLHRWWCSAVQKHYCCWWKW